MPNKGTAVARHETSQHLSAIAQDWLPNFLGVVALSISLTVATSAAAQQALPTDRPAIASVQAIPELSVAREETWWERRWAQLKKLRSLLTVTVNIECVTILGTCVQRTPPQTQPAPATVVEAPAQSPTTTLQPPIIVYVNPTFRTEVCPAGHQCIIIGQTLRRLPPPMGITKSPCSTCYSAPPEHRERPIFDRINEAAP